VQTLWVLTKFALNRSQYPYIYIYGYEALQTGILFKNMIFVMIFVANKFEQEGHGTLQGCRLKGMAHCKVVVFALPHLP